MSRSTRMRSSGWFPPGVAVLVVCVVLALGTVRAGAMCDEELRPVAECGCLGGCDWTTCEYTLVDDDVTYPSNDADDGHAEATGPADEEVYQSYLIGDPGYPAEHAESNSIEVLIRGSLSSNDVDDPWVNLYVGSWQSEQEVDMSTTEGWDTAIFNKGSGYWTRDDLNYLAVSLVSGPSLLTSEAISIEALYVRPIFPEYRRPTVIGDDGTGDWSVNSASNINKGKFRHEGSTPSTATYIEANGADDELVTQAYEVDPLSESNACRSDVKRIEVVFYGMESNSVVEPLEIGLSIPSDSVTPQTVGLSTIPNWYSVTFTKSSGKWTSTQFNDMEVLLTPDGTAGGRYIRIYDLYVRAFWD
ncbi:MAG: hypothetical protein GHCLOJNM_00161 [bacterium]|nr:hypothetical protein [bacterium]